MTIADVGAGARRRRVAPAFIAAALALTFGAGEALAEPSWCRQMQEDYLSADRAASPGGDIGKIRRDLAATQAQARRLGCQRFLFFGPKPSPQCPAIMAKLNQLQRDANRSGGFGWGNFGRQNASFQRDRLRDSLQRNGCSIPLRDYYGAGGYRTLCVRTCDGYYFPISFSTGRNRFKVDESVCKYFYNGSEAELFVHANGSPVEGAVSLKGERYTSLANAFAFRSSFSLTCQAELHDGLRRIAAAQETKIRTAELEQRQDPKRTILPLPVQRMARSEDPETRANFAGNFRVEPIAPAIAVAGAEDEGEIRQLGSAYYYETPVILDGLRKKPAPSLEFGFVGSAEAGEKAAEDEEASDTKLQ